MALGIFLQRFTVSKIVRSYCALHGLALNVNDLNNVEVEYIVLLYILVRDQKWARSYYLEDGTTCG